MNYRRISSELMLNIFSILMKKFLRIWSHYIYDGMRIFLSILWKKKLSKWETNSFILSTVHYTFLEHFLNVSEKNIGE